MPGLYFDTHVHLERYAPEDRIRLLAEAEAAGVTGMLAVSTTLDSSRRTAQLPEAVHKAIGIHPTRAESFSELVELAPLASQPGVVAIGETGFDAAGPDARTQRQAFEFQCALARDHDLAVVLHVDGPGAWEMLLEAAGALQDLRVIRHYFRGAIDQISWHAGRGHFVSFGRPLIKDPLLAALAPAVPDRLLLIETDSYPLPGRTTEPRSLPEVASALATARRTPIAALAPILWENTLRALRLGPPNSEIENRRSETDP